MQPRLRRDAQQRGEGQHRAGAVPGQDEGLHPPPQAPDEGGARQDHHPGGAQPKHRRAGAASGAGADTDVQDAERDQGGARVLQGARLLLQAPGVCVGRGVRTTCGPGRRAALVLPGLRRREAHSALFAIQGVEDREPAAHQEGGGAHDQGDLAREEGGGRRGEEHGGRPPHRPQELHVHLPHADVQDGGGCDGGGVQPAVGPKAVRVRRGHRDVPACAH
mmetsp:Transcript_41121/g.68842  ORF Transcript_41121/g.68842 Transcript_41121/m.68842 type:complete len:220 (+) Transcript_41121:1886-2545(+)